MEDSSGRAASGQALVNQAPVGLGPSGFDPSRGFQQCDEISLAKAISVFRSVLPGWWFTVGECSVSADASCGPDRTGPDADLLANRLFDEGFHVDLPQPASMAEALTDVTAQAIEARHGEDSEAG